MKKRQDLRREILRRIRPHKGSLHLDRKALEPPRPCPASRFPVLGRVLVLPHCHLLDVAAHGQAAHIVGVVQVVFDVELVEVQGRDEGCVFGREEGRAEEGEDEVWPVGVVGLLGYGWRCGGGVCEVWRVGDGGFGCGGEGQDGQVDCFGAVFGGGDPGAQCAWWFCRH